MKEAKRAKVDDKPSALDVDGLSLHSDFITAKEEQTLLEAINAATWNTSLKRRTQHYGFEYNYTSKDAAKPASPIPDWCAFVIDRLLERKVLLERPDQLIINEYKPGQGIANHIDHVKSFKDGIVSVSLGSPVIMDFTSRASGEVRELLLEPRSALCLFRAARYKWMHGIQARKVDNGVPRTTRVSLTFRKMK